MAGLDDQGVVRRIIEAVLDELRRNDLETMYGEIAQSIANQIAGHTHDPTNQPPIDGGEEPEPRYELHLAAGAGITLTPDTTAKLLYIAATGASGPGGEFFIVINNSGDVVTRNDGSIATARS